MVSQVAVAVIFGFGFGFDRRTSRDDNGGQGRGQKISERAACCHVVGLAILVFRVQATTPQDLNLEPVSIVVTALVNGLAAGVLGRSLEDVALEAYLALKRAVLRSYASTPSAQRVQRSIDGLESEPTSAAYREELEDALQQEDRTIATDLVEHATELLRLVERPLEMLDDVESCYRSAGGNALAHVVDAHVDLILTTRRAHMIDDADLLTRRVKKAPVSPHVRDEIKSLRRSIRTIIQDVAAGIENSNYLDSEEAIRKMPMSAIDQARATDLIASDKAIHISYQSLRIAVEYFASLNQQILGQIDGELDRDKESNMVLGNAILISELADFVLKFVRSFEVVGLDGIDEFHMATSERIAAARERQQRLGEQLQDPQIDGGVRDNMLEDIANRESALQELEHEWQRYRSDLSSLTAAVEEVQAMAPTLKVIRENAEIQIEVLQLISMINFLKRNTEAIRGTVDALKGFRLAPLTPTRVRRLLGIAAEI